MSVINFFSEKKKYTIRNRTVTRAWLEKCARGEGKKIDEINYIFCGDSYLKNINRQYLNHDYFTDIITFPNMKPDEKVIGGDIYISIDRVRENAVQYETSFKNELHRVMVHGLLHLCGYRDKSAKEKATMRQMEDKCLRKLS